MVAFCRTSLTFHSYNTTVVSQQRQGSSARQQSAKSSSYCVTHYSFQKAAITKDIQRPVVTCINWQTSTARERDLTWSWTPLLRKPHVLPHCLAVQFWVWKLKHQHEQILLSKKERETQPWSNSGNSKRHLRLAACQELLTTQLSCYKQQHCSSNKAEGWHCSRRHTWNDHLAADRLSSWRSQSSGCPSGGSAKKNSLTTVSHADLLTLPSHGLEKCLKKQLLWLQSSKHVKGPRKGQVTAGFHWHSWIENMALCVWVLCASACEL